MRQALDEWAKVAPGLGLDASAFRSKLLWQKDEPGRSHLVLRLKGPQVLVLKRVFAAEGEDLAATLTALRAAGDRLRPFDKAHAPRVLFASEAGDLIVMNEARGKTLDDHLRAGRAPAPLLRRAGAWLSAFHGAARTESRTYQPKFMVDHVARMAAEVEGGTLNVALPDLFLRCCAAIPALGAQCQGQATLSAGKHGDFNLRNILLGPDGETGLDFKAPTSAPVGFDIVRLLMDFAELFQTVSDVPGGAMLAPATLDAFFEGYTLVARDDPAVRFLPHVQLLNDWRLIPPDSARRSWRQRARMDRIEALARNGFT